MTLAPYYLTTLTHVCYMLFLALHPYTGLIQYRANMRV